jgi:hypothetical protein
MVLRRSESAIGIDGSYRTVMPEVSPDGGAVLCQGESGSGASLGAAIAKSDRTLRRSAMVRCSEATVVC